jgi:hypothetical protein
MLGELNYKHGDSPSVSHCLQHRLCLFNSIFFNFKPPCNMAEECWRQVHESTHRSDEMQSSNTHCKVTCNSHGQLLHLSAFEWYSDRLLCYLWSINQTNQSALLLWCCSQTFKAKMAYVQLYHNSALCVSRTDILSELANNSNQFRNDIKSGS